MISGSLSQTKKCGIGAPARSLPRTRSPHCRRADFWVLRRVSRRSTRFTVLGMSLSSLLDIAPAHDFLRALLALVQEFEAIPEERFGGRHVSFASLPRQTDVGPGMAWPALTRADTLPLWNPVPAGKKLQQQQKSLFKVGSRSRKGPGSLSGSSSGGGVGGGGGDLGMTLGADGGDSSTLFMPNIVSHPRVFPCAEL